MEMKDSIYRARERHSARRPGSGSHVRKIILTTVEEGRGGETSSWYENSSGTRGWKSDLSQPLTWREGGSKEQGNVSESVP